jgi:excisionase family DNA binding protein
MKKYTSSEAAKLIGCSRMALYRWICEGRIQAPLISAGHTRVYWSLADIRRVRAARKKFEDYALDKRRHGGKPCS